MISSCYVVYKTSIPRLRQLVVFVIRVAVRVVTVLLFVQVVIIVAITTRVALGKEIDIAIGALGLVAIWATSHDTLVVATTNGGAGSAQLNGTSNTFGMSAYWAQGFTALAKDLDFTSAVTAMLGNRHVFVLGGLSFHLYERLEHTWIRGNTCIFQYFWHKWNTFEWRLERPRFAEEQHT